MLVRFWALTTQPGGLYPDEAAEGVSAQRLLSDPGYHPVFFDEDAGREPLFAYCVAVAFRFFGSSVLVLRSTAAALGVLGVVAVWLAARRFGRWPAIAAMAWAAGSLWLICVSRDGFRNILTVGFGAVALAAMLRWGDRPSRSWAFVAGAALGAGLWTYQPLKLAPLLVIAWLLWMRRVEPERYMRVRATLRWALFAYLVVAAPMIWTAITDFRNYFARGASVLIANPSSDASESYFMHVLKTLGMFVVTGDPNERHDVDALPLLGPVLCVPFASGMWRAWRLRRDHAHAVLLIGLLVFLIPPLVANEGGAPHFLRSLGLAPFIAALIGLGALELNRLAMYAVSCVSEGRRSIAVFVAPAAVAGALAALGALSLAAYLQRPLSARYDAYSFADVQLAAASYRGAATVVVINDYDAFDVRFLDADNLPTIVPPGSTLKNAPVYSLIVAPSRDDIATAAGASVAARAGVVNRDPAGNPDVWEAVP
ncbi:MAG: ArnT family glycosyltransferase [Candidatus Dormibacteria bacterium]